MAIKKITIFWRDIPSQILIQRGRKRDKMMLEHRFQEAIDRAAMRAGKGSSSAYIAEWRRETELIKEDISSNFLTDAVQKLQNSFSEEDLKVLIKNHGQKLVH